MTYPDLTEEQSKRVQEFSRAQVEAMCTYIEAERRLTELERENAKLREACASLYEFAMSEYPDGTELNFADLMRELGVEVPE